jgi:hypothetical protein
LIYNYKGAVIALDPANMLYWLFGGVLFSLPEVIERQAGAREAARLSPWNGWPLEEALATPRSAGMFYSTMGPISHGSGRGTRV